jgi:hypothetical protein
LPVPYYLITITVPEGLRPWLRSHQKQGYAGLLKESAATLQDVARRDKYLGAELGMVRVFHPVGRQLQFHPHVHGVVPAGGLRADGLRWCRPKSPDFFRPQIVLAARFRSRLKTALHSAPEASDIPASGWRQKWGVDVQPVGRGQPALQYLAAYLYRPPLSARPLQEENGQVTFPYQDHQNQTWHSLTLSALEFIRRFLHLVLPQGFQRVRTYGWLSAAAKGRWQRIRTLLDWTVPVPPPPPPVLPPRCPHCGRPLHVIARWVAWSSVTRPYRPQASPRSDLKLAVKPKGPGRVFACAARSTPRRGAMGPDSPLAATGNGARWPPRRVGYSGVTPLAPPPSLIVGD